MNIDRIYIGGWFQRTTLQLSEVYDFLRFGTSELSLDQTKLTELHNGLALKEVVYHVDGLEYLTFTTREDITVKLFEDGLITLCYENSKEYSLFSDIENLKKYYEEKLSKTINYIFSLGAPVPKELANIETVYPYFIVLNNANENEINELLAKTEGEKYFTHRNNDYDVIRGNKYYFVNNKKKQLNEVERYIEEQIFIREFKAQLHRYLNLHRIIWERIDEVKENAKVKGKDIVKFSSKLDGYNKTVNLIDGRIKQMGTYLKTREKIAKNDADLKESLELIGYRYETLGNTLAYIQYLWSMTQNYVKSAIALFNDLANDVTSKSIDSLTIVTSMGVGASLLDLFTDSAPKLSDFNFIYFFILAGIGFLVSWIMKWVSARRTYEIDGIEYDKDIK